MIIRSQENQERFTTCTRKGCLENVVQRFTGTCEGMRLETSKIVNGFVNE